MNNLRLDQLSFYQGLEGALVLGEQGIRQTMFFAGEYHGKPGRWIESRYWEWDYRPDFRTVLWNEVLFDFDHPLWSHNWTGGTRLQQTLERMGIPYTLWFSGNKGIHISVLLDANGSRGMVEWTDVRAEVYNRLCLAARITTDQSKVYWRDSTMGSLIRFEGGMRRIPADFTSWNDADPEGYVRSYKYWMSYVPRERVIVSSPFNVHYPHNLRAWKVPKEWIPPPRTEEDRRYVETTPEVPELVRRLIAYMALGNNLNDFGRYAVASHLLLRGYGVEQLVPLYRGTPNFNEAITRRRLTALSQQRDLVPPGPRSILQRCGAQLGLL